MLTTRHALAVAAVLITAGGPLLVLADGIQKWRTPDGRLYFGGRPPAGSTLLGTTENLTTFGSDNGSELPTPESQSDSLEKLKQRRAAREAARKQEDREAKRAAQRVIVTKAEVAHLADGRHIVDWEGANLSDSSVYNVRVSISGRIYPVNPSSLPPKGLGKFIADVSEAHGLPFDVTPSWDPEAPS